MISPSRLGVSAICLGASLWAGTALAGDMAGMTMAAPADGEENATAPAETADAAAPADAQAADAAPVGMLGDMAGLRPFLARSGITFTLSETSEFLGNATGGTRKGMTYDGLTTAGVQWSSEAAGAWQGGTFNASALQIHGRNLSAENLQTLQTASGIESNRATRLWELWYQQEFAEGLFDVKLGQQAIDSEFITSTGSALFINTMMGWPMIPSADLPGGGPAYPLSSLGVRLRAHPSENVTLLAGIFNGRPYAHRDADDSQADNDSGTSFGLNRGGLGIAEAQYTIPGSEKDKPFGVYKIGFWYDTESFGDQRYDSHGLSLADPASDGSPAAHHGNYSLYGVIDQQVWKGGDEDPRSVNAFARIMGTPDDDRNLVDFSINAGLTLKAPLPGREDDTAGIGFGYTKVGDRAAGLDRDIAATSGVYNPERGSETFIELTYQYQATPWWVIQPDIQYVFHPGAGLANPNDPGTPIKNELVWGARTVVNF